MARQRPELRNVLYRAAAMTGEDELCDYHLEMEHPRVAPKQSTFRLDKVPEGRIRELVRRHEGNLAAAAREIGVARTTLRDKVRRLDSSQPELRAVAN